MTEKEIATCITFHFPVTYLQKKMWWKVKKKVLKPLLIIITESILNRSFYTGCIMKNLWCYNFLIFYPILTNDTSNKIVLETL
jgi:hypothetical protein